ncbi:MAG: hypothetical protein ACI3ZF_01165 [Candidatus Cryptobacteroides sp.]
MKHFFSLICALLSLIFIVTSCFPEENEPMASYFSFVTVDKSQDSEIILRTDNDKLLYLSDDSYVFKSYLKDSKRIVAYYDVVDGIIEDLNPATIKLYQLDTNVFISKSAFVKTEAERDELGTDPVAVNDYPYFPSITEKYMNIFIGTYGLDPYLHCFTTTYVSDSNVESSTDLVLSLCHNANSDTVGYQYWHWLSIPLADFEHLFPEKKLIKLKIRKLGAMEQSINFSLEGILD